MIQTFCTCGQSIEAPESELQQPQQCAQCGTPVRFICAEPLADGAGVADFDARLSVEAAAPGGPPVGQHLYLGGVPEITVGKLADKHIALPGQRVSRFHCKLMRRDFGPSRWAVVDNQSTNGLIVNGQRVAEHELESGDVIKIGEYQLRFSSAVAPEPVVVEAEVAQQAAEAPALPRAPKRATGGKAKKLQYASGGYDAGSPPLLGDADTAWVLTLRNASQLMLWSLLLNFLTGCIGGNYSPFLATAATLVSWFAAWLLTAPEPGAPESDRWISVRLALRVVASVSAAAQLMVLAGAQLKSEQLQFIGTILSLFSILQTGLFLWYLRRLALRIPSPALAVNIAIVGIGMCASLGLMIAGTLMGVVGRSAGGALAGLGFGAIGVLVFSIWYIVLLFWFNKSFS